MVLIAKSKRMNVKFSSTTHHKRLSVKLCTWTLEVKPTSKSVV